MCPTKVIPKDVQQTGEYTVENRRKYTGVEQRDDIGSGFRKKIAEAISLYILKDTNFFMRILLNRSSQQSHPEDTESVRMKEEAEQA